MHADLSTRQVRRVFRDDHEQFRSSVRRFIEKEWAPNMAAWNRAGMVTRNFWQKAGREGVLCPTLPTEYGGGGGDFGHAAVLAEEIADADVGGAGFGLHSDIVAPYILRLGSEQQKRRWLPGACAGESILAIAMTEPGCGSDVKAIRTSAKREGDEYVINGSKTFISNGLLCDLVVVACKTDTKAGAKGVSLIVVEANRDGFRRGRKLDKVGMHAQDTAELHFNDVRVPVANRLGEEGKGFAYLMQELPQERFLIAVSAARKLERLLENSVRYVKERPAFDGALWDLQNTRFTLANIKADAMALRAFVDALLQVRMERHLTAGEAAVAKLYATETLWRGVDAMVQLHGGYGYMLEQSIARAFVDTRVLRIYGGSNEVMRELIARNL